MLFAGFNLFPRTLFRFLGALFYFFRFADGLAEAGLKLEDLTQEQRFFLGGLLKPLQLANNGVETSR